MPTAEFVYRGYSRNRLQTSVATGTRIATEAANGFIESLPISSAISSKLLPIPYCVGYQWISPAHCTRHFPVQNVARATYRDILERRAKENRADFIEGVATAITPLAFLETVMVKGYQTLVDEHTSVSYRDGMDAALKLNEITRKDEGAMDRARTLADMGRIIEVVRTFIPSERWPEVQAALRGETPASQQTSQAVDGVRMVAIDDSPDKDDT
jgi:hypothetical protein